MSQPQDFGFTEEIGMLKDAAQRMLAEKQPLLGLREATRGTEDPYHGAERTPHYDGDIWHSMVELGWHLLAVPEEAGGLDMGLGHAARPISS